MGHKCRIIITTKDEEADERTIEKKGETGNSQQGYKRSPERPISPFRGILPAERRVARKHL